MKKNMNMILKTSIRSGTLEKTIQYLVSFFRVFFYLNFFLLILIAGRTPGVIHEPHVYITHQEFQLYVITVIVLAALFNSLMYQWEEWHFKKDKGKED